MSHGRKIKRVHYEGKTKEYLNLLQSDQISFGKFVDLLNDEALAQTKPLEDELDDAKQSVTGLSLSLQAREKEVTAAKETITELRNELQLEKGGVELFKKRWEEKCCTVANLADELDSIKAELAKNNKVDYDSVLLDISVEVQNEVLKSCKKANIDDGQTDIINNSLEIFTQEKQRYINMLRKCLEKSKHSTITDIDKFLDESEVLEINDRVYIAKSKAKQMLIDFAQSQLQKQGWTSVKDSLPEEGQIVDVWRMPSTDRKNKMKGIKPPQIAEHEITGWRSTNWIFKKEMDGDDVLHTFMRVRETTGSQYGYPAYEKICIENGEVTHYRIVPQSPNDKK